MAVTTTTVQTDRILAELIHEELGKAPAARTVALNHCCFDSIAGEPGLTKNYPRNARLAAAAAGTEGTDITATTTLSLATQLSLTCTEGAVQRSDVTYKTMERRIPGFRPGTAVTAAIASGDGALLSLLAEDFARLWVSCMEKVETDAMALLDDFSTVVGTTTNNFTLAQAEAARLALTDGEMGMESQWVYLLAPAQVADIRNEIAITSGGAAGGVWSTDIQSIVAMNPSIETTGLVGLLFGHPVYQTSTSVNPDPNSGDDVAGALLVSGQGQAPNASHGALVFLEGNEPKFLPENDASARHVECVVTYEYALGERYDEAGVSIITDA